MNKSANLEAASKKRESDSASTNCQSVLKPPKHKSERDNQLSYLITEFRPRHPDGKEDSFSHLD